jgi:hypothetical protein
MRIRAVISVPMLPAQNQPHITDNRRIGRSLGESRPLRKLSFGATWIDSGHAVHVKFWRYAAR